MASSMFELEGGMHSLGLRESMRLASTAPPSPARSRSPCVARHPPGAAASYTDMYKGPVSPSLRPSPPGKELEGKKGF